MHMFRRPSLHLHMPARRTLVVKPVNPVVSAKPFLQGLLFLFQWLERLSPSPAVFHQGLHWLLRAYGVACSEAVPLYLFHLTPATCSFPHRSTDSAQGSPSPALPALTGSPPHHLTTSPLPIRSATSYWTAHTPSWMQCSSSSA